MKNAGDTITIGKHVNRWCVVYASNLWSEPIRRSLYWPITMELDARIDGATCTDAGGNGLFNVCDSTIPIGCYGRHFTVRLTDGASTQPIHTVDMAVPKPKTTCQVQYADGRWWKKMKRGLVAA